jgi:GNAT superfamily N-acetyltransferase
VAVRLATVDDAGAFGRFEATLGYPVTEAQARVRIRHIHENTCGAVFVFMQPLPDAGMSSSRGCDPRERGPSQVRYYDTCGAVFVSTQPLPDAGMSSSRGCDPRERGPSQVRYDDTCGAVFVSTQPILDAGMSSSRGRDPRERGPSQVRYDDTCGAVSAFSEPILLKGWAHIHAVPLLASEGYAEIGGLAVADDFRRQGVGKALIEQCKEWTRAQGFTRLRLYSGMHRTEAHAFYQALGFDGTKAPAFTLHL